VSIGGIVNAKRIRKRSNTARWDLIVEELVWLVSDLARLTAAATGEPRIVAQLREASRHAARAGVLALPLSRYGGREEP
jgi:hypothetical protein